MRRAFIVGNGPSLAKTDLELLIGVDTYACNNIHLIYPRTKWRPTYYVRAEAMDLTKQDAWHDSVQTHLDMGIPCYMSGFFKEWAQGYENYHELKHCHHHKFNFGDQRVRDEWHLPQPCQFGGSLIVAMQLAVVKGYTELVLIGCDLGYKDGRPSHFDNGYEHGKEQPAFYANNNNLWAHVMGINYHARRHIPYRVINATVGGDLHLYPRVRLEDIV